MRARVHPGAGGVLVALAFGSLVVLGGLLLRPATVLTGAKPIRTAGASLPVTAAPTEGVATAQPESTAAAGQRLLALDVATAKSDPRLLYGVSPDGRWWASRDSLRGPGSLHLRGADGSAVALALGPVDRVAPQVAAFSPDSSRLAVADGAGALWVVDLTSTKALLVARGGPSDLAFGASLAFADGHRLYVQLVGSVEAPIPSRIGVVDLETGDISIISEDPWAYGPRPLANGGVAYAHLDEDGSFTVRREAAGEVVDVADVGFLHGGVDISAEGRVAFSDGSTTWIVDEPGAVARRLGAGTLPRLSPDGRSVVVYREAAGRSVLLSLAGDVLADVASPFVWLAVDGKEP